MTTQCSSKAIKPSMFMQNVYKYALEDALGEQAMNGLESRRLLADAALDERTYWTSLTSAAIARGLLSDGDVTRIQSESAALFVRQAERLTRGESTSLRTEKACVLMESIAYVLGVSLRSCADADEALKTLLNTPLEEIFGHGLAVIRRQLARLRAVHARLT